MTFQILDIAHLTDEELVKHARRLRTKKTLGRIDPREEQQLTYLDAEGQRRVLAKREAQAAAKRTAPLHQIALNSVMSGTLPPSDKSTHSCGAVVGRFIFGDQVCLRPATNKRAYLDADGGAPDLWLCDDHAKSYDEVTADHRDRRHAQFEEDYSDMSHEGVL